LAFGISAVLLSLDFEGVRPYKSTVYLVLPLFSSLLYVAGALFVKQAAVSGVGIWRTTFVANLICAALFPWLLLLGGRFPDWTLWWQPAVVAFLFLSGQMATFLALEKGDVSVATPVLGAKVVLVAVFTAVVLREALSTSLWLAAVLSSLGIAFLNRRGPGIEHRFVGRTILLALGAAAAFAMFDILVQKWAPIWGAGRFLPMMMGFVALYSFALVPFFQAPLKAIQRAAWRPLLAGGVLIALQAIVLIMTIAVFGDATSVNVVYSLRGLWSVLAVIWLGRWFENREAAAGRRVLQGRMAGAILLCAAIVLLFL
jgi:drug/metabolite transporter (DMT)-like permease